MAATEPRPRRSWGSNRGSLVGGIIALLVIIGVALLILWILDNRREEGEGILGGSQPQTVSELTANPSSFYGEDVIVSGEVSEILNPFAFVITDPVVRNGQTQLLVIAPAPPASAEGAVDETLSAQDVVQVAGVLHEYEPGLIERELGATSAELDLQSLEGFEGQSVLIGEISSLTPAVTSGDGEQASVDEIMSNPSDYYDDQVIVSAEVADVISDQAFVLEGGLLVVDATGQLTEQAFEATTEIQVSGVVRELNDPATVAEEHDITLDASEVEQYQGGPVLIGEVITIIQ